MAAPEPNELTEQEAKDFRAEMVGELWGDEDGTGDQPSGIGPGQGEDDYERGTDGGQPPAEDPWAGVSPALRQQFETLQAKANQLDAVLPRLKQAESRIGSITNQLHQAKQAATELKNGQEDAPTQEQIDDAAKSDEEWKELEAEFPEWTKAVNARLKAQETESSKTIKALQDKVSSLEQSGGSKESIDTIRKQITIEINRDLLAQKHSDFEQIAGNKEAGIAPDPNFIGWYKIQKPEIQQKCNSWRAVDAIDVLDKFKSDMKAKKTPEQIKSERKQRLEASQLPSSGRGRTTPKAEDDMTDAEYRMKMQGNWDNL